MEVDVKENVVVAPSTSTAQSGQMESAPNLLSDMVTPNVEKKRKNKEYLIVEANPFAGVPDLKLQAVDEIVTTDKKESKVIDDQQSRANTSKMLKENHVCTSNCFPSRKYYSKAKTAKFVCAKCVLECPKGNGKTSRLDLDSLSNESRKRVTTKLTRKSKSKCCTTNKSCTEKPMTLETSEGTSQNAEYDEAASESLRAEEEEKLWNEFFDKQAKGESSDFMEVLGAALGKKLSRGSPVPCHLCFRVLPLWLHRCHVRHYHDPYKMNVCRRCTRRYSTLFLLRRHLRMAHKRYVGNCVECRKIFFLKEMFELKRSDQANGKKQKNAKRNVRKSTTVTEKSEETKNNFNEKRKIE